MLDIRVTSILLSLVYSLMFTDEVGSRFDCCSSEEGLHEARAASKLGTVGCIEVEFILHVLDSSLSFTSQNFNSKVSVYRNHDQHATLCNGESLVCQLKF